MDEFDHDSNASSDNEHEHDDDLTMQDVDADVDVDVDNACNRTHRPRTPHNNKKSTIQKKFWYLYCNSNYN